MNDKEQKYCDKHDKSNPGDTEKCAVKLLGKELAKYLQKTGYDVDKDEMEWTLSDGYYGFEGSVNFAPSEKIHIQASYKLSHDIVRTWDYDSKKRSILQCVKDEDKDGLKDFLKEVKKYCKKHDRYEEPEEDVER